MTPGTCSSEKQRDAASCNGLPDWWPIFRPRDQNSELEKESARAMTVATTMTAMTIDPTTMLTVSQAAKHSGLLTEAALRNLIHIGKLPVVRIGHTVLVPLAALEALLKHRGVK